MNHKLDEQAIREILVRAEEIHLGASSEGESEHKALIKAAEEAGLPRDAIEQALRERLESSKLQTAPGEFVFAPSADGKLYVAEVIESNSTKIRVKFLNGSESTVSPESAQAATFLPGTKVYANWPHWGWWNCTVLSYDQPNRLLRLTDGMGSERSFPLTEIRINPPKSQHASSNFLQSLASNPNIGYVAIAMAIAFVGALVIILK